MGDPGNTFEDAIVALEGLSDAPLDVDPTVLQRLLSAAVTAYAARRNAGDPFPPFPLAAHMTDGDNAAQVPPTVPDASSVCLTVSAMLDAVSVEVFELAMWQAWSGAAGR